MVGHGVDALFVVGATVVRSKVLRDGGSDHAPIVHWLRVPGVDALVVVLQWNVYVGQPPMRVKARLRWLLRRFRPDVVVLCEAYRCRAHLASLAERFHYQHVQGPNVGEGADCALLLSLRHRVKATKLVEMRTGWQGLAKHGRPPRSPRVYPRGRVELTPDIDLRALSLHFPTASRANEAAVEESVRRTVNWLKR